MNFNIDYRGNKGFRLLSIYERLNKGELLTKDKLVDEFGVSDKTIQRDIDDLRAYLVETHYSESEVVIKYDKKRKGYYLIRYEREWLTNEEVLALSKIVLESRAFEPGELKCLIKKLLGQVVPHDRKFVENLLGNEYKSYVPLKHGQKLLSPVWELSNYISRKECISFDYTRQDKQMKNHKVKPVGIMFSEFYFYLIAFLPDKSKEFPIVFRIDRIKNITGTKEKFIIPYKDRFDDCEFRKRVQFMYTGELRKVTFEFKGDSLEAILDRLPTATVVSEKDGWTTITAETYGKGVDMWLKSQGDWVKIIE